jgi:hypothetical protein
MKSKANSGETAANRAKERWQLKNDSARSRCDAAICIENELVGDELTSAGVAIPANAYNCGKLCRSWTNHGSAEPIERHDAWSRARAIMPSIHPSVFESIDWRM